MWVSLGKEWQKKRRIESRNIESRKSTGKEKEWLDEERKGESENPTDRTHERNEKKRRRGTRMQNKWTVGKEEENWVVEREWKNTRKTKANKGETENNNEIGIRIKKKNKEKEDNEKVLRSQMLKWEERME